MSIFLNSLLMAMLILRILTPVEKVLVRRLLLATAISTALSLNYMIAAGALIITLVMELYLDNERERERREGGKK